jgi:hypothetical protein
MCSSSSGNSTPKSINFLTAWPLIISEYGDFFTLQIILKDSIFLGPLLELHEAQHVKRFEESFVPRLDRDTWWSIEHCSKVKNFPQYWHKNLSRSNMESRLVPTEMVIIFLANLQKETTAGGRYAFLPGDQA